MAGRAAEHLVLGEGSTGSAADVTSATELATRMVCEYGLSPTVGPVGYGSQTPTYIEQTGFGPRGYAEATQRHMDREVARLVREAEEAARALLTAHRGELDELAGMLLEKERIDGDRVYALVGRSRPGGHRDDGRPERPPR